MNRGIRALALLGGFAAAAAASAQTANFNAQTSILALPSVSIGTASASNATVRLDNFAVLSVGSGGIIGNINFDPQTNILGLPTVTVGGTAYRDVRIRLMSYAVLGANGSGIASSCQDANLTQAAYDQIVYELAYDNLLKILGCTESTKEKFVTNNGSYIQRTWNSGGRMIRVGFDDAGNGVQGLPTNPTANFKSKSGF